MKNYETYYKEYYQNNKEKYINYRKKYKEREGQKKIVADQQNDWRQQNKLRNRLTAIRNKCNTLMQKNWVKFTNI
jgi:hypothetical protein